MVSGCLPDAGRVGIDRRVGAIGRTARPEGRSSRLCDRKRCDDGEAGEDFERFRVVKLHGRSEAIVAAYANTVTCGCRMYLAQLPDPADHLVFRLEPMVDAS